MLRPLSRMMPHAPYVLFLTYADYRLALGGLERYVQDEMDLLRARKISSICLFPFPTKRSRLLNRHLARFWGARIDGRLAGFYCEGQDFNLLAELGSQGKRLLEVQIHHLGNLDLARVARWISSIPVPIRLLLHDFHTVCPKFNLLRNNEKYCGDAIPSPAKCTGCVSWTPDYHARIRTILEGARERLTVVAPSPVARRIWLSTFPDFADRLVVVPHLKSSGTRLNPYQPKPPGQPLRIAFVGMPYRHKGWETFLKLADELTRTGGFEFFHFGRSMRTQAGIRNIPVSYVRDGREAMTAALQRADIDIVFLWSLCPETYGYTMYESRMANAMLITNPDSGNLAEVIGLERLGRILPDEEHLLAYLRNTGQVRRDVEFFRGQSPALPARMEPNPTIPDSLNQEANPTLPAGRGRARSAGHVAALYGLKRLKHFLAKG